MDNLFEYLIYGFIIVSFISSFFRKKKTLNKETPGQPSQQQPGMKENIIKVPPFTASKAEDFNFLNEIEGFFNVGEPVKKKAEVHSDKEMYEGTSKREEMIPVPEKSFHEITDSEHTFENPWDAKRKQIEKTKKEISSVVEKQASVYEKTLKKKVTAASDIRRDIRKRLKNPASLKEYVIISEIMGKPKVFK